MTKAHLAKAEIIAIIMRAEINRQAAAYTYKKATQMAGERLREKRVAADVSVREMARRLKLSAAYVSDVEVGRRNCTIKFADAFMEALTQ